MATTLYLNATKTSISFPMGLGKPDNRRATGVLSTSAGTGVYNADFNTQTGPVTLYGYAWISDPVDSSVTISGTVSFKIGANESSMSANVTCGYKIEKVAGSDLALTTIIESAYGTELTTSAASITWTGSPTSTQLNKGDRIRVTPFIKDANSTTMQAGYTAYLYYSGTSTYEAYVQFSETLSFPAAFSSQSALWMDKALSSVNTSDVDRNAVFSQSLVTGAWGAATIILNGPADFKQITNDFDYTDPLSFWSPPLAAATLTGPVRINAYAGKSTSAEVYVCAACRIYITDTDGSNPVLWASGTAADNVPTATANNIFYLHAQDASISAGKRLRFVFGLDDNDYAINTMIGGNTVSFRYGGGSGSGDETNVEFTAALKEVASLIARPPAQTVFQPLLCM